MKRKVILIFVGAIALTFCSTGSIVVGATLNSIVSEDSTSTSESVTIPANAPIPPLPGLAGLNLTPQQQEQIKQISQDLQPQFLAVAPPLPQLTAEQKAKIQQLLQASRSKIEAILTPEQLEQLRQNQDTQNTKSVPAFDADPTLPPGLAALNLTQEQQEQIKQIIQETEPQLQAALPAPPQLTAEQEAKIQQLMQSYREQVEAILTPEQQQQFRQNLEQFHQRMEQIRQKGAGS